METRKTPLALTASALALALMLAGCGGGSSSSTEPTAPAAAAPPTPTPPPAPEPEPMTVMVEFDGYMDASYLTVADVPTAVAIAAGATGTVGPYMVTNGGTATAMVTIEDGVVMVTGVAATDIDVTGFTMAAADAIKMAKKDEETTMAEMTGRAAGLSAALSHADVFKAPPDTPMIARGLSGDPTMTINGGEHGWETEDAGMSISKWHGTMLKRGTDSYTVYTNIDAAKPKDFSKEYALGGTSDNPSDTELEGTLEGITVKAPVEGENPYQLMFTQAGMQRAANAGLLGGGGFPTPNAPSEGSETYKYDNEDKKTSFKGMFHGASGTYACTNTGGCMLEVTAPSTEQGPMYTAGTDDTWTFTPDEGAKIADADAAYQYFGWWVDTPAKATDKAYPYEVMVFYGGMGESPPNLDSLHGEATYNGSAAGLFAVPEVKANAEKNIEHVPAAHGQFTATAMLKADFGDATDPVSVTGTIGTFKRNDGVANSWELTLGKGKVISVDADATGTWEYQLYGGDTTDNTHPTAIAGRFEAHITGLKDKSTPVVAGGFGATRQ